MKYCRRKALARMVRARREDLRRQRQTEAFFQCLKTKPRILSGTVHETSMLVHGISNAIEDKRRRDDSDDLLAAGLYLAGWPSSSDSSSSDNSSSSDSSSSSSDSDWSGGGGDFSGGGASGDW